MPDLENFLTSYKLDRPVLTGSGIPGTFDALAVDCPFVFQHAGQFYLMFVGFDGQGYQTGLARSPGRWDSKFCSDPCVVRSGEQWAMYYFGYDGQNAQDGIAFSTDLLHWDKHPEPILPVGPPGTLDSTHAHKPSVIRHEGMLYHFYCACRPARPGDPAVNQGGEFRCITVASSAALD